MPSSQISAGGCPPACLGLILPLIFEKSKRSFILSCLSFVRLPDYLRDPRGAAEDRRRRFFVGRRAAFSVRTTRGRKALCHYFHYTPFFLKTQEKTKQYVFFIAKKYAIIKVQDETCTNINQIRKGRILINGGNS